MATQLFNLTGKIALVSGASRGIGEEIAKLLAEQGAHVIVSSRKIDDCTAVADDFMHIRKAHGKLHICVNNAATNPYFGHVLDTDLGAFSKTVEVNIRGYFFMSIEAGKLMREHGGGAIVNTASISALQPGPMQGIYSITKAAVVNMTKVFAKECAPFGIRCNALLPGLTKTKFAGALFSNEDIYQMAVQAIPMGRHAEPSEMAGTVLYLVSDASSYTTGECITVDGGITI
jgi:NAD(P)-dependent dehydrogenase (short-subunit alcohol dehydrogenase family)